MKRKEFNALNVLSPASGKVFTFEKGMQKLLKRSVYEADPEFTISEVFSNLPYKDFDADISIFMRSEPLFSDSPIVEIGGIVPIHITCTKKFQWGKSCNYKTPRLDNCELHLEIIISGKVYGIGFNLAELTSKDFKTMGNIVERIYNYQRGKYFMQYFIGSV